MKRAVYQSISKYKQLLIKPNRRARTKQGSGKFPCSVQGFCCRSHENHSFCKAVSLLSPWALIALLGQAIQENAPLSAWLKEGKEGIWLFKSTMCSDKKKTQPIIPREDNVSKWIGTPHLRPGRSFSPLASVFTRKPRIPQLQWEMENLGISSIQHWKWFFPQTDRLCLPSTVSAHCSQTEIQLCAYWNLKVWFPTDSWIQKANLWLSKRRWGRVVSQEVEMNIYSMFSI